MSKFWKKYKINIIVYLCIVLVLSLTIFANAQLTYALNLRPWAPSTDTFSVHFVDVGQGSCALVHFDTGEDMLIDSGTPNCTKKLASYINNVFFAKGDKVFEYVILTHSHNDHSGSMAYIINNYKIINFYRPNIVSTLAGESGDATECYVDSTNTVYADTIKALKFNSNINVLTSHAGTTIVSHGKTLLTMYSPELDVYEDVNDYSPIMVFGNDAMKVCITGDASQDVEIVATNNYDLPDVDILCLGHHGSYTATSMQFMEAVKPERVVISVGKNKYGHPSSVTYETLNTYDTAYNKNTYDTKMLTLNDGNIIYYQSDTSYKCATIKNIDNYLHMDYWQVVLILDASLLVIMIKPIGKNMKKVAKARKYSAKSTNKKYR